MKKLVLGIVAIFFLQVGFVAYNAIESYVDEASNANSVGDPLAGVTENSVISDSESLIAINIEEPTESVIANKRNLNLSSNKKSVRVPPRTKVFRQSQIARLQRPSEVKLNKEYAATASTSQPFVSEFEDHPKDLTEKRSFVSKTLPILKKPYSWIKSIASKIN